MDDAEPELLALLVDKDTLQNAIVTSHDNHLGKILKLEETITEAESEMDDNMIAKVREDEYHRNRFRVAEIFDLVEKYSFLLK